MLILYRISDGSYKKSREDYISKEICLQNCVKEFGKYCDIKVIADNLGETTLDMVRKYIEPKNIEHVSVGHGAGTFNYGLDIALMQKPTERIYFLEDDYIHAPNSYDILVEGFSMGFPYYTLYDHPDKYKDPSIGGNPLCQGGAENTRVYLTHSCHWKMTNSTTMTFATNVRNLEEDEMIMRKWTRDKHPDDMQMFFELRKNEKMLLSPMPSYATHGDTGHISPLRDWRKIALDK